ncbi:glutamyl-tRNA amidotransferase subunit A [Mycotypha africana]|uniref:glutamyl-tRNA amidotransferase subunit A n=1 Tax=Mycotypha africana TaxID=64632 RepID=UPI0023014639|nr:glutamyl-tRNA amidotransferase subunit A [Mycotypha africana]KAI8992175.1 glutamyl-tRNA amidotransferase subunit A [Mycotypha africana]
MACHSLFHMMLSTSLRKKFQCRSANHFKQSHRLYSALASLRQSLNNVERHNSEINAFISLNDTEVLEKQAREAEERYLRGKPLSRIDGMTIGIKDNICTSSLPTTCASNMLRDFTSPYDATVVKMITEAGGLIMGKTNMDEFGMGSLNKHTVFGPVINPIGYAKKESKSAGGSSGGSAASVAMNMCTAALGSDTGGSIRMPASYCGIVGFKPTYGRCSRYGLVAYANSLDTIGILARSVEDCSNVYDVISPYDEKDPTSMPIDLRTNLSIQECKLLSQFDHGNNLNGLVVGVPQEFYVDSLSDEVIQVWRRGIKQFKELGATIKSVSLPHISLALPAYYILAFAEASSNLSRYDGIRYGHRRPNTNDAQLYENTRTNGFGDEVKRRILLGTHILTEGTYETLFLPAQKVRRTIQKEFNQLFKQANLLESDTKELEEGATGVASQDSKVDILLVPSATSPAPLLSNDSANNIQEYLNDVMTLPANLAGIPAITLPFASSNQEYPIGLQLMGQYGYDRFLLKIAKIIMKEKM